MKITSSQPAWSTYISEQFSTSSKNDFTFPEIEGEIIPKHHGTYKWEFQQLLNI